MANKFKPIRVKSPSTEYSETVKFQLLACGNVTSNNNKFYCIEVQKNASSGTYCLFTHYGRIGKTNVYEIRETCNGNPITDLSLAEAEFERILKNKKKTTKGKSTYETVDTQAPSVGSDNIRNVESGASTASSSSQKGDLTILELFKDSETKTMVKRVWEENVHSITNLTTMNVTSSGISTPLGPLTLSHIDNSMSVLNTIKNAYNNNGASELMECNSKYFSMIPHPFGHKIPQEALIDDDNKFLVEFDLLEQMKSAIKVGGEEATVEQVKDIGVDVSVIDRCDPVWKAIENQYITSKAACHSHMRTWNVKNIFQVDHKNSTNNYKNLEDRFKAEEFDLFHGSRSCNILSILMNGLMIPPSTAGHVTGRMFGDGVYGASASTKALNYATGYWSRSFNDKHPQVYMFVVKFAMGRINYPNGTRYNGAPSGYDSIWAKARAVNLANDEFIVYNTRQAKLTHLIQLEG